MALTEGTGVGGAVKGVKQMAMESGLTLGSKHAMQHTNDVLQNFTLETYIILLIHVTPMNLI